jgi:hypothetical protein
MTGGLAQVILKKTTMGLVTDVYWNCPGCNSKQHAQTYGEWNDPGEFHPHFIPVDRGLSYNPPCTSCGNYQLLPESKWTKHIPQPCSRNRDEEN